MTEQDPPDSPPTGEEEGRREALEICCLQCNEIQRNNRRPLIQCTSCFRYAHIRCVGVKRNQARELPRWNCRFCLEQGIHAIRNVNGQGIEANRNENEQVNGHHPEQGIQAIRNVNGQGIQANRNENEQVNDHPPEQILNDLILKWKSKVHIISRIPKGARNTAAEALNTLIREAVEHKNQQSWTKLLGFSFAALRKPVKSKIDDPLQPSLATQIKNQTNAYMRTAVIPEVIDIKNKKNKNLSTIELKAMQLKRRVSAKFAEGDVRGAVRITASDLDLADFSEDTLNKLREKHPPTPLDIHLPEAPEDLLHIPITSTKEDIKNAIRSFAPGSAAGPDGIRPGHLKDLIANNQGLAAEKLLKALESFTNMVLNGDIPEFALPIFYGASLCALSKKDGGLRPIAVGNTFRRLAAKVAIKPIATPLGSELQPVQLGFGTLGGCEAASHATRNIINSTNEKMVILKIDMKNAFNCIRRDSFLKEARSRAPSLYKMLWQTYSKESSLFFGQNIIASATGLQQGDPLAPALFSLGIDPIVKMPTSPMNVWYLDDGTLGGTMENVIQDLESILPSLISAGLAVNDAKCELILLNHDAEHKENTLNAFKAVLPNIKVLDKKYQSLLGSPLNEEALHLSLENKKNELITMVDRLSHLDAHQAFLLLKNCFSIPKLLYILRASPAYKSKDKLNEIDQIVKDAISLILNIDFNVNSWKQATLPVNLGGIGIRKTVDVAIPAFLSSLHSTSELTRQILNNLPEFVMTTEKEDALRRWNQAFPETEYPEESEKGKQKSWDKIGAEYLQKSLLDQADQVSRCRLQAASCPESGLWLHAIPIPSLGTALDQETLRIAVALRTGSKICEPHKCVRCQKNVNTSGHHALSCQKCAGRFPRHSALNDVMKRALQSANFYSVLEPPGLGQDDMRRPDGMTLYPYKSGKNLIWDCTCVDTFANSNLIECAIRAGAASKKAEATKIAKYADFANQYDFRPIAVETTGVMGPSTLQTINDLGNKIQAVTGDKRETFWLKQRIGIAVARGNAISIIASSRGE